MVRFYSRCSAVLLQLRFRLLVNGAPLFVQVAGWLTHPPRCCASVVLRRSRLLGDGRSIAEVAVYHCAEGSVEVLAICF